MAILIAFLLFLIQIPIKTALLALKATLKTLEMTINKVKSKNNSGSEESALKDKLHGVGKAGTKAVKTTGKAVKTTGKAVKTTGKAAKTTVKVGIKGTKLAIKGLKLAIRALKFIIMLIRTLVTFLLSLGIIGVVILVVIILILAGAVGFSIIMVMNEDGFEGSTSTGGSTVVDGGSGGSGGNVNTNVDTSSLVACCESLGRWYIANINTYQCSPAGQKGTGSRKGYKCDIFGTEKTVYDDCTGFSAAYASLVSGKSVIPYASSELYAGGKSYIDAGWKRYTTAEIGGAANLLAGDILVRNEGVDSKTTGHHAEIYLSPSTTFGWGSVKTNYPVNATAVDSVRYPGYIEIGSDRYGVVYRYEGTVVGAN